MGYIIHVLQYSSGEKHRFMTPIYGYISAMNGNAFVLEKLYNCVNNTAEIVNLLTTFYICLFSKKCIIPLKSVTFLKNQSLFF